MHYEVIVAWLAGMFGLMAVTLALVGAFVAWPVLLVAAPLGATAALLWYHASGRLHERMERRAYRRRVRGDERDPRRGARSDASRRARAARRAAADAGAAPAAGAGGTAAGPGATARGAAAPGAGSPGAGRRRERQTGERARATWGQGRHARSTVGGTASAGGAAAGAGGAAAVAQPEMTRQRALSILDLGQGADDADVRDAYRSKVKETHPDSGGDVDAFTDVTDAYERLGGGS